MSDASLALRLRELWRDWCATHDPDNSPWPAEAFMQWAARELYCELVVLLGDDRQCILLRELSSDAADRWPTPMRDTDGPDAPPESSSPVHDPMLDAFDDEQTLAETAPLRRKLTRETLLAATRQHQHVPLEEVPSDRDDLVQEVALDGSEKRTITFYPQTRFMFTWLDFSGYASLEEAQNIDLDSFRVAGEEQLVVTDTPLVALASRVHEGTIRVPPVHPGASITLTLKNKLHRPVKFSIRLHGIQPMLAPTATVGDSP